MKRQKKQYSRPQKPFDKIRIEEENVLKEKYGLKNKKEIWKADAKVRSMREKAKRLIGADMEKQKELFNQLNKIGMRVESIGDVLSLKKENYLNRRLQTVLVNKKFTTTPKSARQLITHKKVLIKGKVVSSPSYVVPVDLENKITLKPMKQKKIKAVEVKENVEEKIE